MITIPLEFDGYWLKADSLTEKAGIYCIYRCTYSQKTDELSVKELLYIGEADNIRRRLCEHKRFGDCEQSLDAGEQLCYSRALIGQENLRVRAEAALIYHHSPPENIQHIDSFGYPETEIVISGKHKYLDSNFTVDD